MKLLELSTIGQAEDIIIQGQQSLLMNVKELKNILKKII
jgi:hypothetical protein